MTASTDTTNTSPSPEMQPQHEPQPHALDLSGRVHEYPDLTHTLTSGASALAKDYGHSAAGTITASGPPSEQVKPGDVGPDFASYLIGADELDTLDLAPRPLLLGQWMKQGDLGYLFAPRGAGKSWMSMLIGNAVAEGAALGDWNAGEAPREVIYFDAEMNLADVQERARKLGIVSPNFRWLSNERLFLANGAGVNISLPNHQRSLSTMLPDGCLFIIDNLSTAQLGMSENDNDSFDAIRDWLLAMRHRSITTMIVHHAGRNGSMRGSSRREDMAHWVISLKEGESTEGIKSFTTSFEPPGGKVRNCPASHVPTLRWSLTEEGGGFKVGCKIETGDEVLLEHITAGVTSATELAELLGVQAGTVSKRAHRLLEAGLIVKDGREYRLPKA